MLFRCDECQKFIFASLETTTQLEELSREELIVKVSDLTHRLAQLERLIFGSKHERFVPSPSADQLSLDIAVQQQVAAVETQTIQYDRTKVSKITAEKVQTGRMALPASLPRQEEIISPAEDVTGWTQIGTEVTEVLERIPGKLFVIQYKRPKYKDPVSGRIVIGELPSRPIDKGIPGPGLLAQIVIDKYVDHIPINRQGQRFEREGMKLPVSTLAGWISGPCDLVAPLYELHRKKVLGNDYLQADETPIRVLDKAKKGTTHRGYHWVYHAPVARLVLFDYQEGRGEAGPGECLKDFQGYLQTDGYAVYDRYDKRPGVTLLHCMAHARRKFDEALENDRERAEYVLTEMQKLYAVERMIRDASLSGDEIVRLRQEQSVPVLQGLKYWMMDAYAGTLPQSAIGKALNYSLQRWDKLSLYTTDAKLQIDNNLVENAIRPVAIGRKNYLFAGSHNGARRAAMLYSFVGTCKINNVNPFDWLKDVLQRMPDHPVNKLEELLPNNWAKTKT